MKIGDLRSTCGSSHNTAKAWISILEASYVAFLLPAHYRNFGKRLVKAPKLYFWRDSNGNEIDLVADRGELLYPVEFKAGQTIAGDWLEFELIQRGAGCSNKTDSDLAPSFLSVVPDLNLPVTPGLRAKNRWLQSISPRATATSSSSSALVRGRPGPDASPSSIKSRRRFFACSSWSLRTRSRMYSLVLP